MIIRKCIEMNLGKAFIPGRVGNYNIKKNELYTDKEFLCDEYIPLELEKTSISRQSCQSVTSNKKQKGYNLNQKLGIIPGRGVLSRQEL